MLSRCVKYHKVCPSQEELDRDVLSTKAVAGAQKSAIMHAPLLLTIRVQVGVGEFITYFFVKDESAKRTSNDMFHVPYQPEDNEHAHSKRTVKHAISFDGGFPIVDTSGSDGFSPVVGTVSSTAEEVESGSGASQLITASLTKKCYGLCFTVTVSFTWFMSSNELEGKALDLMIEPCEH
jgi:hypothetical protein